MSVSDVAAQCLQRSARKFLRGLHRKGINNREENENLVSALLGGK